MGRARTPIIRVLTRSCLIALVAASAAWPSGAFAQGGFLGGLGGLIGGDRLIAGVGFGATAQPYREPDDEVQVFPIPLISYQVDRFEFVGKTLGATLWSNDNVALTAIADWRFQGYEPNDSPFLEGMDERDGTLEAGGRFEATARGVRLTVTAQADVLSRHGGYEVAAQGSFELSGQEALSVRPSAGVRYQSGSLTDYYFGVDPEEVVEGVFCPAVVGGECPDIERPAYEADDAFVPFVGVTARQAFTRKIAVIGSVDYNFLPDTITDSPIVEDDGLLTVFAGLVYVFGDVPGSDR